MRAGGFFAARPLRLAGQPVREKRAGGGSLYLEINEAFSAETQALLTAQGYADVRGVADMFGRNRMVVGRR